MYALIFSVQPICVLKFVNSLSSKNGLFKLTEGHLNMVGGVHYKISILNATISVGE